MTTYQLKDEELHALKGKTILITGAATGIGRAAVDIMHQHGANIVIGDWSSDLGEKIAQELGPSVLFHKTDVSNWDNVLSLFEAGHKRFGTIHAVLSNAGINTHDTFLEEEFDPKTGKLLPPDLKSMDVNFVGQTYVVKVALHYFKKWPEVQCQIVMTASAGAFFPAPPIYYYCAAKSAVLGFMRGLRYTVTEGNATINCVCPWLTVTPMLQPEWLAAWGDLPQNTPAGVGRSLMIPIVRPEINGKAFFIAGNEAVEFEDTLQTAQPYWMGQKLSDDINEGQTKLIPQLKGDPRFARKG